MGGNTNWLSTSYPVFKRGYSGLFGYNNNNGNDNSNKSARAVVVCGSGLLQKTYLGGDIFTEISD